MKDGKVELSPNGNYIDGQEAELAMNMSRKLRITLITKTDTANVGNQALSTELTRLVQTVHAAQEINVLGFSSALERYSWKSLRHSGSGAVNLFDRWAEHIVMAYRSQQRIPLRFGHGKPARLLRSFEKLVVGIPLVNRLYAKTIYPNPVRGHHEVKYDGFRFNEKGRNLAAQETTQVLVASVKLHRPGSLSWRLEPAKRPLRKVRRALVRFNAYRPSYEKRLRLLEASDLVIFNPAGEMGPEPTDRSIRQLLELRVAQKLGCRVMVVNHSVEVKDPVFCSLIAALYSEFDSIVLRDHLSRHVLVGMGVPEQKIRVAADGAFLATPAEESVMEPILRREAVGAGTVAIAVQYHATPEELIGWGKIIQELKGRGKQIIFVSNCLAMDRPIGVELQRRFGVRVMSQQYDYPEYIGLLSEVELLISQRLHSCVFGMIGNTPVAPIGPKFHKVAGLFQMINYPVSVVDTSQPGWAEDVLKWVDYIYEHYGSVRKGLEEVVGEMRKAAQENVRWDLGQAHPEESLRTP